MTKPLPTRQGVRRALLLLAFVAFPVTLNYFSPYLIIDSGSRGIVNGSAIVFASMFAGSLVLGRLWCGWACPAAGLQEPLLRVNNRRVGRKADLVKWFVWVPWVALVAFVVLRAGGYRAVDALYGTVGGISTAAQPDRPILVAYLMYFLVVGTFLGVALAEGRRGACHTICWMAPFMIAGRWVRNLVAWPALRLRADAEACTHCHTCTVECPMSIDVEAQVASGSMENTECVLCGMCADGCPQRAIRYSFSSGKG